MKCRRIILNNDYYNIFQITAPVTDQDIHDAVDKIADTQVDTLTLDTPATLGIAPMLDADIEDRYQHPHADTCMKNLRDLLSAGKDPFGMVVERAHAAGLEIFVTVRMNDTHYKDQPFNPMVGQFYYDHLHDRLGPTDHRYNTEFDYRKSAVRAYYLDVIRQTVERYDVDGVEMNLTRNCRFFPTDHAEECAPVMTQFVRDVRKVLDEIGEQRGRRLALACMVPYGILGCKGEGLDLVSWARLGLIDIVSLSTPFLATFDHDAVDAKLKLGPDVQVMVGCDRNLGYGFAGHSRVVPMQTYRAMAMNAWRQGVDGIHLFNVMSWTMNYTKANESVKRHGGQGETTTAPIDYDRELLNELGAVETITHRDKLYVFAPSVGSADGELPLRVPPGGRATARLRIGDDLATAERDRRVASIEVQTVSSDCDSYDNYTVLLNGIDLSRQYAFVPYAERPENVLLFDEPGRRGPLPAKTNVRRHSARSCDLMTGINEVTIVSHRAAMTVTDVEIAIRFR